MSKNWKKFTAKKINFWGDQKLQFTSPKASRKDVQATESRTSNMKFLNFFLFLWVIFALLDTDPDSESGYVSTDLIDSGSNPDSDPKQGTAEIFRLHRSSLGYSVRHEGKHLFLEIVYFLFLRMNKKQRSCDGRGGGVRSAPLGV
jgi:hypothetical protein